jgi:hypothetical protein
MATEYEIIQKLVVERRELQVEIENIDKEIQELQFRKKGHVAYINLLEKDTIILCDHTHVLEYGVWDGHRIVKSYTCSVCESHLNINDLPINVNKKRKY